MKLLLYCTKAKPYITKAQNRPLFYPSCVISDGIKEWHLNGKIIAECDFEVEEIESPYSNSDFSYILSMQDKIQEVCSNSCLTKEQLFDYVKWNKEFYAIHIKNLHIFDKSRELSEYKYHKDNHECYFSLGNAPQNMM